MSPYWFITGIDLHGTNDLVEYSTIYNCREYGVTVYRSNSGMQNCVLHDIGWNGFSVQSSPWEMVLVDRAFCINSEVYRCSDSGLDSQAQNTIFTGNYVHHICPNPDLNGIFQPHGDVDAYWAIAWEDGGYGNNGGSGSGTYALCTGNVVDYCSGQEGIYIYSGLGATDYVLVSGNTVSNCNYGIIIDGSYSKVEYNTLNNCVIGTQIGTDSGDYGNTVYANTYNNCRTNYLNSGSGTIFT